MATIPRKETPDFPNVYVLEETDPVTGGLDGIDNLPHKQLAERDDYLLARIDPLEKRTTAYEQRLQSVEISGSVSVGRAFPIWLAESDQGADFELFADAAYTWRDYAPAAIVATVAGDESVDVATTNNLVVGDAYLIHDTDGTSEVVEVEAILTATRFRATATLGKTRTNTGHLARTNWDIRAGFALAGNGRYFSREINTLRYDDAGRLIIRRLAGDGNVRVKARRTNTPTTGWLNAPLKRSGSTDDGFTDLEFRLPVGGTIELQVETQIGDSGELIEIHYLVCLPEVRAGRADAVRKPTNVAPEEGATDVMETPALTGNAYYSLYGIAHQAAQFEVATDADFANIVYQGSEATPTAQHTVASGTLATNQVYFWRCRYQDTEGTWSPWSKPSGFSTGSVFEYVAPPVISSPSADATRTSLLPTIVTADFDAVGAVDTHAASQYQIATDSAFGVIVYDSGTVTDLISHSITIALARETRHYLRVRHQGAALGWSDWSVVRGFTTTNSADQPSITSPADGATDVAFNDGLTVTASSFSFPGGGEAHVASDWEVRDTQSGDIIASRTDDGANLTRWVVAGVSLAALTSYEVRVRFKGATTGYSPWSAWSTFGTGQPVGEATLTSIGFHDWEVPAGVSHVSAMVIGGGSNGNYFGGGGGGVGWKNDIPVTPGNSLSVVVGGSGSSSSFADFVTAGGGEGRSGGHPLGHDGGGSGGEGGFIDTSNSYHSSAGGGGAGGYSGTGGRGAGEETYSPHNNVLSESGMGGSGAGGAGGLGTYNNQPGLAGGGGGGIGIYGIGASGTKPTESNSGLGGGGGSEGNNGGNATGSQGGHGGLYGGGGGGISSSGGTGGNGAPGAVRIIWGPGRSFPENAA